MDGEEMLKNLFSTEISRVKFLGESDYTKGIIFHFKDNYSVKFTAQGSEGQQVFFKIEISTKQTIDL